MGFAQYECLGHLGIFFIYREAIGINLVLIPVGINRIHQPFKLIWSKNNHVQSDAAGNRDGPNAYDHKNNRNYSAIVKCRVDKPCASTLIAGCAFFTLF
jgi:hypothetical protein